MLTSPSSFSFFYSYGVKSKPDFTNLLVSTYVRANADEGLTNTGLFFNLSSLKSNFWGWEFSWSQFLGLLSICLSSWGCIGRYSLIFFIIKLLHFSWIFLGASVWTIIEVTLIDLVKSFESSAVTSYESLIFSVFSSIDECSVEL